MIAYTDSHYNLRGDEVLCHICDLYLFVAVDLFDVCVCFHHIFHSLTYYIEFKVVIDSQGLLKATHMLEVGMWTQSMMSDQMDISNPLVRHHQIKPNMCFVEDCNCMLKHAVII